MDKSNGYEEIASDFIKFRGNDIDGIGKTSVQYWVQAFPQNSTILDLGCGTGIPISKVLLDAEMNLYGIDASPTLVNAFIKNLPGTPIACESVEDSSFFSKKFDGIIAWGLIFLLPINDQAKLIQKVANALKPGGKFLFTAPFEKADWKDLLTGKRSTSLGAKKYRELLSLSGLSLIEEFDDEGKGHYFNSVKI